MQRRQLLAAGAALAATGPLRAQQGWAAVEAAARGQTVVFNAWGGSARINAYLQWAAAELKARHGVVLEHVKLADTAEFVRRIRAEKAAGRAQGSADLVWINGENFLTMKREGLLHGPWAEQLPNFAFVDVQGKPTTRIDFAEPVDGLEAPWGMAQLTFFVDTARAPLPAPATLEGLLDWARRHPGRFTYPKPPQFIGTTFLKQALTTLNADRSALGRPHTAAAFDALAPALWRYLDALHPLLWRGGRAFPASPAAADQMLADGELALGLSFNPNDAANAIAAQRFPATVQAFQLEGGTLGNTHFVAIPFNAPARAGAQVVANFLLSPLAQARKADLAVWGDPTVLAVDRLPPAERARFGGAAVPGQVQRPMPVIPEPHGSWVEPLERAWQRRYGA